MQLSTRKFLNYIKEAINYRRRSLSHFNGSAPSSGSGDLFSPGALPGARPRARVPPAPSCPTPHTHSPPRSLGSHPAHSQPSLHAPSPPHTLISHLAHSPGAPHTHFPPCTIISVPSYPTSYIPLVPHTLVSHPTHSYPTLHTHFRDLKSHPRYPSPCPARSCHTPRIPRPRWRLGTSVRGGFVLLSSPWPHPVALAGGPWHRPDGDPPLPKTPHSTGVPFPGWVSPAGAPHGSPAPGGLWRPWGPFWGAGAGGAGGARSPPPGLAFNILFDWFAWLRCRKTFANIPEQPGSA